MGVLQRFERRLESLVNRPFAKAFKAEVQPVEVASRLQRECDDRAAIVARGRTMVPNDFTVALGPHDHERLNVYAQPLGAELAAMVREHAEEQGYSFHGPVTVGLELDEDLPTGQFNVRSAVRSVAPAAPVAPAGADGGAGGAPESEVAADVPWVEIGTTTYALRHPVTRIGRGTDCDLRIDDPGVSRHHAELQRSGGDVTLVDVGSTNGVSVDGERVTSARLRDGAVLMLGSTPVTYRQPSTRRR